MEEKTLVVDNLVTHYKTFGPSFAPTFAKATVGEKATEGKQEKTVLVLHGWGKGSRSWVEFGELMARAGYQIIVPDLPGFGQSQEPEHAWDFDDYIRFIEQFVTEMKLDKFYLVGHSLGGALAAKFGALHPGMVKKLILCDAAIIRRERLDWRQEYAKKMAAWKNRLLELPFARGVYPLAKKLLYKLAGTHDYELASHVMKETFKKVLKIDTLEYAHKLKVPVLIVWGDSDKSTPVEDAYEINKTIKNSRLEIIAGAGHKLHRTHALQLTDIIARFVLN